MTNDALLGSLYDIIVAPTPQPGSAFLTSDNTAIIVIRQGPPESVGVALGRRLSGLMLEAGRQEISSFLPSRSAATIHHSSHHHLFCLDLKEVTNHTQQFSSSGGYEDCVFLGQALFARQG